VAAEQPEEIAPKPPPKKRLRDRAKDLVPKAEPTTRKRRGRATLETIGSLAWGGAARVSIQLGQQYMPVSKMMAFQAPVAGMVFEDALRGTVADKVLQPVARMLETGSEMGTLLGAPLVVGLTCAKPDLYPVTRPMLASMMKEWVIIAGPKLRKMREREEKFAAEMETFGAEFGMSIDQMLDEIFAPPVNMEQRAAANGQP